MGREGSNPYPVGELLNHLLIEHNVLENINVGPFTGDGNMFQILNNPSDVTVRYNERVILDAATLAVEQANQQGGYRGIPFEFVVRNDLPLGSVEYARGDFNGDGRDDVIVSIPGRSCWPR